MNYKYMKRSSDIVAGLGLMALSVPIAVVLAVQNRGDVFFSQKRVGQNWREFDILKFKTMSDVRSENGELLPDDKRITRFGHFLRKTGLDEAPQGWNILKGDMALVGPRPQQMNQWYVNKEMLDEVEWIAPVTNKILSVKQGLFSLDRVLPNENNVIPRDDWCRRIALDSYYVNKQSFKTDMRIVLKFIDNTARSMLHVDGAPIREHSGVNGTFQDFCKEVHLEKQRAKMQKTVAHSPVLENQLYV